MTRLVDLIREMQAAEKPIPKTYRRRNSGPRVRMDRASESEFEVLHSADGEPLGTHRAFNPAVLDWD